MRGFCRPAPVSARQASQAVIAAGAAQPVQLLLAPSVMIKLLDLRVAFYAPAPPVAGSNVRFLIDQIRVGDGLVWNTVGTDSSFFGGDSTLKHMVAGRYAAPAQPIFVTGQFVNLGSVASATPATVSASVMALKR